MNPIRWYRPELIGMHKIFDDNKAQYDVTNRFFDFDVDRLKDVHHLDDMFCNPYVLKRMFFFDIWHLMVGHNVSESIRGPSFSKSAAERTSIYFSKPLSQITIHGTKTYSRRSEGKERTYPAEWLAKRVMWFLEQSAFVESAKLKQNGLRFTIDIKFKSCYSESRTKMIRKRQMLTEKTRLGLEINALKYAIENYDTLENLQKRLAKTIVTHDNIQTEFFK